VDAHTSNSSMAHPAVNHAGRVIYTKARQDKAAVLIFTAQWTLSPISIRCFLTVPQM